VFQGLFTYIKYDYDVTYYVKSPHGAKFKQIGLTCKPDKLTQRDVRSYLKREYKKEGDISISVINLVEINSTRYWRLPWKEL
jgi:hypothetical protein